MYVINWQWALKKIIIATADKELRTKFSEYRVLMSLNEDIQKYFEDVFLEVFKQEKNYEETLSDKLCEEKVILFI